MPLRRAIFVCLVIVASATFAHANQIVVRSGDNLWSLARAHGTTVAELMAANDLTSERLSLGQVLRLPGAEPGIDYTVQPSDTLYDIARRFGVSVEAIQAANALGGTVIRPGQTLAIPGATAPEVVAAPAPAVEPPSEQAQSEPAAAPPVEPAVEAAAPEAAPEPAPEAAAQSAPVASAATLDYVVRPADTLYDIARAHGVSVDSLIAWNRLDGTLIRVGQVLSLTPGADQPTPQTLQVTVRNGDNLWTLARTHDTTVAAIASANGLDPQGTLRLGQTLTIPGRYAAVAGADGSAPAVGGPAASEIRVGPGESLWTIAQRHGTTVGALMELNGLASDRLQVGQALRVLPGGAPTQALPAAAAPQASVPSSGMVWPLVGNITSRFGYRRLRIGGTNMHYGLDIDGNVGDPIRSATAGTVTFSGWRGGFGYLVIVTNGDTEYFYAHASALLVSEGQRVQPGDLIARVGATGNVTGPHLHFEIRVSGTAVDPLPILEARATR
jgi:murein DD-endopeptidase MepM/ murein hydrolase activator NlpD